MQQWKSQCAAGARSLKVSTLPWLRPWPPWLGLPGLPGASMVPNPTPPGLPASLPAVVAMQRIGISILFELGAPPAGCPPLPPWARLFCCLWDLCCRQRPRAGGGSRPMVGERGESPSAEHMHTIGPRASAERRVELDLGGLMGEGDRKPSVFDQSGPQRPPPKPLHRTRSR